MRLYIAGPMRGRPGHGYPDFHEAAAKLRDLGYEVVNPAELHPEPDFHPSRERVVAVLKTDLKAMLDCDGLALLDGWTGSEGALIECGLARDLDIKTQPLNYWLITATGRL